jgi:hypothetical protein
VVVESGPCVVLKMWLCVIGRKSERGSGAVAVW